MTTLLSKTTSNALSKLRGVGAQRAEILLALILVMWAVSHGSLNAFRLLPEIDSTFAGFTWNIGSDGKAWVNVTTPSSWPAMQEGLRNMDRFDSIDGLPLEAFQRVFASKNPGDPVQYEFLVDDGRELRTYRAESFTLDRYIESVGVLYGAGLLYVVCGVLLVALGLRSHDRLLSALGWLLILVGAGALANLQNTIIESRLSFGGNDLLGAIAVGFSGTLAFQLASVLSSRWLPRGSDRSWLAALYLLSAVAVLVTFVNIIGVAGAVGTLRSRLDSLVLYYVALGGTLAFVATLATIIASWRGRPDPDRSRLLIVGPLFLSLLLLVAVAIVPFAVARTWLLPSSVVVPLVGLVPLVLLFAALADRWLIDATEQASLAEKRARMAEASERAARESQARERAQRERQQVESAITHDALHGEVLPRLGLVRLAVERTRLREGRSAKSGVQRPLADALREVQAAMDLIRRKLLHRLRFDRPYRFDDDFPTKRHIEELVGWAASTVSSREGAAMKVACKVQIDETAAQWPEVLRILLYTHLNVVVQNALLHGRSQNLEIAIRQRGRHAEWSVSDDGVGFNPSKRLSEERASGLQTVKLEIEERAGSFEIISAPGGGCTVIGAIPIDESGTLN